MSGPKSDHDKDILYELYVKYGKNQWPQIAKDYNEKIPGKKDEEGNIIPWTKEILQKKRNNYKTHGQWGPPEMKTSSNPQLLDDENGGPSKKIKLDDEIPIVPEENLSTGPVTLQRYVSISIFSYFSV